ncbi:MAG: hypothetical protein KDD56_05770 [Bdellovibrionales bacterium]|nr:hypothetical protein [Bdellovibrionales bacterium]
MFKDFNYAIDYIWNLDNWESNIPTAWDTTNNHKRVLSLLKLLKNPEKKFKKIIVGGTNGKGSTSNMISEIIQAHGYETGTFNSPHVNSIKERVRINSQELADQIWLNATNQLKKIEKDFIAENSKLFTTFEALTGLAALIFAEAKVDFAIFEVGLGGKYDATNSWGSDLAVLTTISKDHIPILGNSLEEITRDKITIARPTKPLITTCGQESSVLNEIRVISKRDNYDLQISDPLSIRDKLSLTSKPVWFLENAALSFAASKQALGLDFSADTSYSAINKFSLKGRFQILKQDPYYVIDTAHNPQAIKALINSLKTLSEDWTFLCGFTHGHLHEESIEMICKFAKSIIFTEPETPKKVVIEDIKEIISNNNLNDSNKSFIFEKNLESATKEAIKIQHENLCICGSFYLFKFHKSI